jgi:hypothetical protein
MSNLIKIEESNLPALYNVADSAAIKGQKTYVNLFVADLVCTVLGAIFSAVSFTTPSNKLIFYFLSGVSFFVSLLITLILSKQNYEKQWYAARAIAESVKTISWKYMMCAEPYHTQNQSTQEANTSQNKSLQTYDADSNFPKDLINIFNQHPEVAQYFEYDATNTNQITQTMKEVRAKSLGERKEIYKASRLIDQQSWYSKKGKDSHKKEGKWFWFIIFSQFCAFLSVIVLILFPEFPINLVSIFPVLATTFLSWLQMRRHQELAQSYNYAATELLTILQQIDGITTEDDFSVFVADAETAISREHTLWLARRDSKFIVNIIGGK